MASGTKVTVTRELEAMWLSDGTVNPKLQSNTSEGASADLREKVTRPRELPEVVPAGTLLNMRSVGWPYTLQTVDEDQTGELLRVILLRTGEAAVVRREEVSLYLTPDEVAALPDPIRAKLEESHLLRWETEPAPEPRKTRPRLEADDVPTQSVVVGHDARGAYLQVPRGKDGNKLLQYFHQRGIKFGDHWKNKHYENRPQLRDGVSRVEDAAHRHWYLQVIKEMPEQVTVNDLIAAQLYPTEDYGRPAAKMGTSAINEEQDWFDYLESQEPVPQAEASPIDVKPPALSRPKLVPGMRVWDGSDEVIWDGLSEHGVGIWEVPIQLGVGVGTPKVSCSPIYVMPLDAVRADITDPRIKITKDNKVIGAKQRWTATYPDGDDTRTVIADTRREAVAKAAANMSLADWHREYGWAAARDELPPIDITAIKPGDVVTTFNGSGRYAEPDSDRYVVASIDETGVELARETDPTHIVRASVFEKIATHEPADASIAAPESTRYRYLATQRPLDQWTMPTVAELAAVGITQLDRFDYEHRTDGQWGWVEYDKPLPADLTIRYEFTSPDGSIYPGMAAEADYANWLGVADTEGNSWGWTAEELGQHLWQELTQGDGNIHDLLEQVSPFPYSDVTVTLTDAGIDVVVDFDLADAVAGGTTDQNVTDSLAGLSESLANATLKEWVEHKRLGADAAVTVTGRWSGHEHSFTAQPSETATDEPAYAAIAAPTKPVSEVASDDSLAFSPLEAEIAELYGDNSDSYSVTAEQADLQFWQEITQGDGNIHDLLERDSRYPYDDVTVTDTESGIDVVVDFDLSDAIDANAIDEETTDQYISDTLAGQAEALANSARKHWIEHKGMVPDTAVTVTAKWGGHEHSFTATPERKAPSWIEHKARAGFATEQFPWQVVPPHDGGERAWALRVGGDSKATDELELRLLQLPAAKGPAGAVEFAWSVYNLTQDTEMGAGVAADLTEAISTVQTLTVDILEDGVADAEPNNQRLATETESRLLVPEDLRQLGIVTDANEDLFVLLHDRATQVSLLREKAAANPPEQFALSPQVRFELSKLIPDERFDEFLAAYTDESRELIHKWVWNTLTETTPAAVASRLEPEGVTVGDVVAANPAQPAAAASDEAGARTLPSVTDGSPATTATNASPPNPRGQGTLFDAPPDARPLTDTQAPEKANPASLAPQRELGLANLAGEQPVHPANPSAGKRNGVAVQWRPTGTELLAPSGAKSRFNANLDAIEVLRVLQAENRYATVAEQEVLARYSSFGAVKKVFDVVPDERWASEQAKLREVLDVAEFAAANHTILNAHYTDPRIAKAMWDTLAAIGVTEGLVLEPGAGVGIFEALAPEKVQMVGVELDPTTAAINSALNPNAQVINAPLEKTRLGGALPVFDAVIGNVPFGEQPPYDPIDNPDRLSLHNAIIAKSLAHTRGGGLVMVLTSAWTLDADTSKARQRLASMGELVGAIRLPAGAMRDVAGTDVIMDCLVFRRYYRNESPDLNADWVTTEPRPDVVVEKAAVGEIASLNKYWANNPSHILGDVTWEANMYGRPAVMVRGLSGDALAAQFAATLSRIMDAKDIRLGANPATLKFGGKDADARALPPEQRPIAWVHQPGFHTLDATDFKAGHIRAVGTVGKKFETWNADRQAWVTHLVPLTAAAQTVDLLKVRDAVTSVLESQDPARAASDDAKQDARAELSRIYDAYVERYGTIGRTVAVMVKPSKSDQEDIIAEFEGEWRAGLPGELSLEERQRVAVPAELRSSWKKQAGELRPEQRSPHLKYVEADPAFPLLLGLETLDDATGHLVKSSIFTQDLVGAYQSPTKAESPEQGVYLSIDRDGVLDTAKASKLLGLETKSETMAALTGLVYTDPETAKVLSSHIYLSGDVRQKLKLARKVAETDPAFQQNVTALEAVVPDWVAITEITIKPGQKWLGAPLHREFLQDSWGMIADVIIDPEKADAWKITGLNSLSYAKHPDIRRKFGTSRRHPHELLQAKMNNTPVDIYDTIKDEDGKDKQVKNIAATMEARQKQAAIEAAFAAWVAANPQRAAQVEREYNHRFRSYVAPSYTVAGKHLALPGVAITPREHQRSAVARILASPTVLLDHVVGAGKTGVMVMAAMELKRQGIAEHPWVVVPNNLVAQVAREAVQWCPTANILAIPTGSDTRERDAAMVQAATGNHDIVIVGRSTFTQMGLSPLRLAGWMEEELEEFEERQKGLAGTANGMKPAEAERYRTKIKTQYEKVKDKIGNTIIGFEQTGCDFLFVDEAHGYKNLRRVSGVADLAHPGSNMASDLNYKLRALREVKAETAHPNAPVACFATGTPVANNLAEAWVMMQYLIPEKLEQLGIKQIDDWGRMFTESVMKPEIGADNVWKMKDRVCTFINLPELIALNNTFTDTVTRDMLQVSIPTIAGGARQAVTRPASEVMKQYIWELAQRANNLPADMSIDNMLKISNDGRLAALDPRLRGLPADEDGGRIGLVAAKIMEIDLASEANIYYLPGQEPKPVMDAFGLPKLDAEGNPVMATDYQPSNITGGLQIVFCDRSIPKYNGTFNVYDALADELVVRGMERSQISFIHDANTDEDRAALYEKANTGGLKVLIGSTEKMGTGTNIQTRALAVHHMDCPWRPADLEQREGRALRQGNQNREVGIYQYITEGTYDSVTWQIITRKAEFIRQLRSSTARTITAVDDDIAVSAAYATALATGDTSVMRRAELADQVMRLEAAETGWRESRTELRTSRKHISENIAYSQRKLQEAEQISESLQQTKGDSFLYVAPSGSFTSIREDAGQAIINLLDKMPDSDHSIEIGSIGGVALAAEKHNTENGITFEILVSGSETSVANRTVGESAAKGIAPRGLVQSIETNLRNLGTEKTKATQNLAGEMERLAKIDAELAIDTSFPQAQELDAARAELAEIDQKLVLTEQNAEHIAGIDPYLDGLDLERTNHCVRDASHLRSGDMVTGKTLGAGLWVWNGETNPTTGWKIMAKDGTETTKFLNHWEPVELVARRRDSLTALETLTVAAPLTHAPAAALEVRNGDLITTVTVPAHKIWHPERLPDPARAWDKGTPAYTEYVATPDAEPVELTGTVHQIHDERDADKASYARRTVAWRLTTENGSEHTVMMPTGNLAAIRHDVITPVLEKTPTSGVTLAAGLPGDKVFGLQVGKVHNDEITIKSVNSSTVAAVTKNGMLIKLKTDEEVSYDQVRPGRNLTDEQGTSVWGADWRAIVAKDLRAGDRAVVSELDGARKGTDSLATVISANRQSGGKVAIRYRLDGGEAIFDCTRKDSMDVHLADRRIGALTDFELRQVANPEVMNLKAKLQEGADSQSLVGHPIWLAAERGRGDGVAVAASITAVEQQTETYGSYPYQHSVEKHTITATTTAGEAITVKATAEHSEREMLCYPLGAEVPITIDPFDGEPVWKPGANLTTEPAAADFEPTQEYECVTPTTEDDYIEIA